MNRLLQSCLLLIAVTVTWAQDGPDAFVGAATAPLPPYEHPAKRATLSIHHRNVTAWEVLQEIVDGCEVDYSIWQSPPEVIVRDRVMDLRSLIPAYYLLDRGLVDLLLDLSDRAVREGDQDQPEATTGARRESQREEALELVMGEQGTMSFPQGARLTFLPEWRMLLSLNSERNTRQLDLLLRGFSRAVPPRGESSRAVAAPLFEPLSPVHRKLSIMLPAVDLEGKRLPEAIRELNRLTRKADPEGTGLRLRIDPDLLKQIK